MVKKGVHHELRPPDREAKNAAALLVQVVGSIICLVVSIFIARNLGAVVSGKNSFALAFVAIFAVFSGWGYNTLRNGEVARAKSIAGKYLKLLYYNW